MVRSARDGATWRRSGRVVLSVTALAISLGCAGAPSRVTADMRADTGVVEPGVAFHGWTAMVLRNGYQRVTVVPVIGRIMGLDFAQPPGGPPQGQDPFWLHPQVGAALAPDAEGWINHGGDKAWPAPQGDWSRVAGRGWPPPVTFDARAYAASVVGSEVVMESPIDPGYGVRVRRRIRVLDDQTLVTTTFDKVQGAPIRIAIWTITQLLPPDRMFVLLPKQSSFAGGYRNRLPAPPRDVRIDGRLLSFVRDPANKTMIGSDGDALLWVGEGRDLLIETVSARSAPQGPGSDSWPDGAHAQIYTSPDSDQHYVELELYGPLVDLRPGQGCSLEVRYRLIRRAEADPLREAQRVLAHQLTR